MADSLTAIPSLSCPYCEDSGSRMVREPGADGKLIVLGDCPHCMANPQRVTPGLPIDASGLFTRS